MPEYYSIRERIELRVAALAAAIEGVTAVERRDWLDGNTVKPGVAYVYAGEEEPQEGGQGTNDGGTTDVAFAVSVAVCIAPTPDELAAESPAVMFNRMLARIKAALLADPDLKDDDENTEPLSNSGGGVTFIGSNAPPLTANAGEFFVEAAFDIPYSHYRSNPYAGPAVTQRAVPDEEP